MLEEKNVMHLQLSIILPVYQVEEYLPQCLESIVSQVNSREIEVLVIDDGSTDRSGEIADFYGEKYPFIHVVHEDNSGVAAARNAGINMARGEWLYFADSDDWLAEGAIEIMLEKSRIDAAVDVILLDAWKNTGDKQTAWEHFEREAVWNKKEEIRGLQRGALYFPSAGIATKIPLAAPWDKLYRRKFLLDHQIRFLPELQVLDDMVFNVTAFGKARRVVYYKEKIYHYRYVQDSITNSYRQDRIGQEQQVWKYLNSYMDDLFKESGWEKKDKHKLIQAYYCRIIKSFSICCRLSFFHPQNSNGFWDKVRYVEQVLETEPYSTAFHRVEIRNAEWRLKAVICMGRCRMGLGIYLLHKAQSLLL